jgi:LPS sulfotransferase NodH
MFAPSFFHQPMPIIVGSPRSGTTLLRLMLDAHPDLAIPPETGFLIANINQKNVKMDDAKSFYQAVIAFPPDMPAWSDFHIPVDKFQERLLELQPFTKQDGFRLFYEMYALRFGKSRWGDKTPSYSKHLLEIQKLLPEAYFIHIIRDGRDAALSLRNQWFSPGFDIKTQAAFWRDHVQTAYTEGIQCAHYFEIRFEDLIQNTEQALRKICNYIGLDFHPKMMKYYENAPNRLNEHLERRGLDGTLVVSKLARQKQQINTAQPPDLRKVGIWKNTLRPKEIEEFEQIAGDTLRQYGYI